jgi:hypothetical protein
MTRRSAGIARRPGFSPVTMYAVVAPTASIRAAAVAPWIIHTVSLPGVADRALLLSGAGGVTVDMDAARELAPRSGRGDRQLAAFRPRRWPRRRRRAES